MSSIQEITEPILKINENIKGDTSIDEYEYFEYGTIVGTNLNNFGGDIRITIEIQDIFTHPSESFLRIEGRLTKNNGTANTGTDIVSLVNNGMMYLFQNIKYQLSEIVTEQVQYPGQATTMLGLLKYQDDFSKSQGLDQLWYKDTHVDAHLKNNVGFKARKELIIDKPEPIGTFSFNIPLKHTFGSSIYLGILAQLFSLILPHFSSFFLKLKIQDHFFKFS